MVPGPIGGVGGGGPPNCSPENNSQLQKWTHVYESKGIRSIDVKKGLFNKKAPLLVPDLEKGGGFLINRILGNRPKAGKF